MDAKLLSKVLVVASVFGVVSCYGPSFEECRVLCGPGGSCPQVATCQADHYCHAGGSNAACPLVVPSAIAVTPINPQLAKPGTLQFIATGSYPDGTHPAITTLVAWSSSNTAAATISSSTGSEGQATLVGTGQTTISAILGSTTGSTVLTVTE